MYDYIIIGGGISGFYCGLELIKRNKNKNINIVLCEKYKTSGGRISTFYKDSYKWEAGAGRISEKHTNVMNLASRYKHTLIPIGNTIVYKDACIEPILFESNLPVFLAPLKMLDKKILSNSTIKELLTEIHGLAPTEYFLNRFPYRAEVEVLRADLAIALFDTHGEMGSHDGYFVSKDGLSKLVDSMVKDYISKGGKVLYNHECVDIKEEKNSINVQFHKGNKNTTIMLEGKKIICAMESESLRKIPFFKEFKTLDYLRMEPLLRTYAIYNKPWFSQYPRVVTSNPIRYFLPVDYTRGVAMVSYTDSRDTKNFHTIKQKYGEESLGKHIQNLLKELFTPSEVPPYSFFKSHYWKYGATYWLPGNYDPIDESKKSLKPFDSEVYIVGESFSLRQAWIEGSLEQCNKLFDTYRV